jgi:hypothetical protein
MSMTDQIPYEFDVFVSYASEDRDLVLEVVNTLQSQGLRVWYDAIDLDYRDERASSSKIASDLHDALASCSQIWFVVGPAFAKKKWTKFEVLLASARSSIGVLSTGIVYRGIPKEKAKSILIECHLDVADDSIFEISGADGLKAFAGHLTNSYCDRVHLSSLCAISGPVEITIFPGINQIWLSPGGIVNDQSDNSLGARRIFDFTGRPIEQLNILGFISTGVKQIMRDQIKIPVDSTGKSQLIDLPGEIIVGFLNHPGQNIFKDKEIQDGVFINFGFPLVFVPAIQYGPVTVGYMTEDPPSLLMSCLEAAGRTDGDWRRVNIIRDEGTFTIS